jgi:tetratricopeptide (TPR) repeat protein
MHPMKARAHGALAAALVLACAAGCSRNKQQAVILANQGDQIVDLDPNGAIQKYEQAVQLDPINHRILYKLAKAYKKKEEWDRVASTLGRATEVAPSFANYWFERGWALEQQAKKGSISWDECKEPYKKCIEADPHKDECYARLAVAFLWTDKEQEALQNFTKAIEHRPDDIDYYPPLADLYMRLNYDKEAEQVLNAAKDLAPPGDKRLYNVHTLLSAILRDRGQIDKMVAELEAARALRSDEPGILFNLGMAYAKLEPPKKAEALQLLKNFVARACKTQGAAKYKNECEQAQAAQQKLQGPGG